MINDAMHAADRAVAPDGNEGMSERMQMCMPFIKFLDHALSSLPAKLRYKGVCNRGVKFAFPSPEAHDPEQHFFTGRDFYWYEFKSAAFEFKVMEKDCFCGLVGPRTIFTIEAQEGFLIKPFSHYPDEAEVRSSLSRHLLACKLTPSVDYPMTTVPFCMYLGAFPTELAL
jgi:hypothetical protein